MFDFFAPLELNPCNFLINPKCFGRKWQTFLFAILALRDLHALDFFQSLPVCAFFFFVFFSFFDAPSISILYGVSVLPSVGPSGTLSHRRVRGASYAKYSALFAFLTRTDDKLFDRYSLVRDCTMRASERMSAVERASEGSSGE